MGNRNEITNLEVPKGLFTSKTLPQSRRILIGLCYEYVSNQNKASLK